MEHAVERVLRPVILPPELIGGRAPCDLFSDRGVLLVKADSIIAFHARNSDRPTRVYCAVDEAGRISDVDPIAQLQRLSHVLTEIAERIARDEQVAPGELVRLSRDLHGLWLLDADACLGYAHLTRTGRPSISHVIHVSLIAAEIASALRMGNAEVATIMGGALTMNLAKLGLHDEMHASAQRPSQKQVAEIRSHPGEGVRLLKRIGEFDKPWLEAVGSHHENIDGSGYPDAIKGAAIALPARIVRVADTFAARLTGRRTRQPMHWNIQRMRNTRSMVQHIFGKDQEHLDPSMTTQLVGALGRFPPGTLVRLDNGELAVVTRRVSSEASMPREVLTIRDAHGSLLHAPQRRGIGHKGSEIRGYVNDEGPRFAAYDWRKVWGYAA